MGLEVKKEVFAYELIGRSKGDRVELSEEAVKPLSGGWKMAIVLLARIGEPSGSINNEILVISAKTNEIVAVVSEFTKRMIGAFNIINSKTRD